MRYIESMKSGVCERNLVPTLEIRIPNDSSTVSPGAEALQFRQEVGESGDSFLANRLQS